MLKDKDEALKQEQALGEARSNLVDQQDGVIKGCMKVMDKQGEVIHSEKKKMADLQKDIAMPVKSYEIEALTVMKLADKLVAIRRFGRGLVARRKQLASMGFKPVGHVPALPNSRYLWKKLVEVLTKSGQVCSVMHHDIEARRNTRCYRFGRSLNLKNIVKDMCLVEESKECEWVEGMLDGKCDQHQIEEYMVPMQ